MGAIFTDWLNANEQRNYPLHDRADRKARDGQILPNDILVDAHIWLPKTAGYKVFVSSVGISSALITVTFAAAPADSFCESSAIPAPVFVPLAVLRVRRPHEAFKNYDLEAIYPGVGGWAALGNCDNVSGSLSLLFDGPDNTVFLDRTVRAYDDIPVLSLGKLGVLPKLTGTVRLQGTPGQIRTFAKTMMINGELRRVAAIGLDSVETVNNQEIFAGECGHRPEAKNCNLAPITEINGLKPDCDGNINLKFSGDIVVGALTPGGLILDDAIGLNQVCATKPGFTPLPGEDHSGYCEPGSSSSASPEPSSSTTPPSSSLSSDSNIPPDCEYFTGPVGPFTTYGQYTVFAPALPFEWSIELLSGNYYAATPLGYAGEQYILNLYKYLTLRPSTKVRRVSARVKISGQQRNATLIIGHPGIGFDEGFYFFGISLLRTASYPKGKFVFGKKFAYSASGLDETLGSDYVFSPLIEPVGKIWNPGADLNDTEYFVQLQISRSGGSSVIEAWVDWVDATGTARSFYNLTGGGLAYVPGTLEGYAGFGAVGSDTLFNAVGVDCTV